MHMNTQKGAKATEERRFTPASEFFNKYQNPHRIGCL